MTSRLRYAGYALTAAAVIGVGAWASAPSPDEVAVRTTLEHYIQGHATGEGSHMRMAFHPVARLYWSNADTLATRTLDEYVAGMPGKPAPDESARKRKIDRIDIAGTAASAKIILDYPDAYLVDYMSLVKTNGEWRIVNKIFNREMKKK